jgi:hypothetical protein
MPTTPPGLPKREAGVRSPADGQEVEGAAEVERVFGKIAGADTSTDPAR